MAESHHVFGEAAIEVGLGSASALQVLGFSVDGVDIEIHRPVVPIYDDRAGPQTPTDEQQFPAYAYVAAQLIWWDDTIRANVFTRADNGTTEGVNAGAGVLFGAGSKYYRLLINVPTVSPTNEQPWNWPNARLEGKPTRTKVGSKAYIWTMRWFCVGWFSTTSASGSVLYNRVNT
jgi:hypothetical protein